MSRLDEFFGPEVVAAIREEIAAGIAAQRDEPVELLSPAAFALRAGVGRSTTYELIASGDLRSLKVRGRRVIPSSELARLAESAPAPRRRAAR